MLKALGTHWLVGTENNDYVTTLKGADLVFNDQKAAKLYDKHNELSKFLAQKRTKSQLLQQSFQNQQ